MIFRNGSRTLPNGMKMLPKQWHEGGAGLTATQDTGLFMERQCGRCGGGIEIVVASLPGEESGGGTD